MTNTEIQEKSVDNDELLHEKARRQIQIYRYDSDLHEVSFSTCTEDGKARLEVFMVQLENIGAKGIQIDDLVQTFVFIDMAVAKKLRLLSTRDEVAKVKGKK